MQMTSRRLREIEHSIASDELSKHELIELIDYYELRGETNTKAVRAFAHQAKKMTIDELKESVEFYKKQL